MAAEAADLRLDIQRVLPAGPSAVFQALSDSTRLVRWWGPDGFTIPNADFDPRVGKTYRIEMQPPDGEPFYLTGEFREVEPPARIAFTFIWEDPDPDDVETLVTLSLRDLGQDSTEVDLSQGTFKTDARRALHHGGWTDSLDKLAQLLSEADS